MFEAYRIRPVVEWEGSDESRELEAFTTLGEAEAKLSRLVRGDPCADVEPRIFWTLYGVNPPANGVRTDDAIADRTSETAALDLLGKLIGCFTADPSGGAKGYYIASRTRDLPEESGAKEPEDGRSIEVTLTLRVGLALLRQQKTALIGIAAGGVVTNPQERAIEGILNLVDFIQDSIHDQGLATEDEIFRIKRPTEDSPRLER